MAQHHAIMLSHTQLKRPACIRVDRQRIFLTLVELVDSQPVGPADLVERCIQRGTGPAAELHDQHRLTQLKGSARGHVLRPQIGQRQHHRVQLALLTGTLAVRQLEVVITLAGLVEPQLLAIGITPVRGGDLLQPGSKQGRTGTGTVNGGAVRRRPLSPISAPLDQELEAQLQSEGVDSFLTAYSE